MKIKVAKRDLEAATKIAALGMASGAADLSGHYLFRLADGRVDVLGKGTRVFSGAPLPCTVEDTSGAAMFTVEGWRLDKWVKALGDVAVTIECESSTVKVTGPNGSLKFASLDPSRFEFWDDLLAQAKATVTLRADRLMGTLRYLKPFIGPKEVDSKQPGFSVCEVREGTFYACNLAAVTAVRLQDGDEAVLADSNLTIHRDNMSSFISFLTAEGDENVTVLEHDNCFFMKRGELVCGATDVGINFPELNFKVEDTVATFWEVECSDLRAVIEQALAGAKKDEKDLRFKWDSENSRIAVVSISADDSENTLYLKPVEAQGVENLSTHGMKLRYACILDIMTHFSGSSLRFEILPKTETAGMVQFRRQGEGGDHFAAVMMYKGA